MSFLWGLFRIYLNYFRCAHFTHTRTHMHSNTRRETRTHIGFFTAPICIRGGLGGWCLYILYILWRGPNRNLESADTAVVVLPRATQSTQWAQSILEKSSQPLSEKESWPNFPPPKKHVKPERTLLLRESEWAQRASFSGGAKRFTSWKIYQRVRKTKAKRKENSRSFNTIQRKRAGNLILEKQDISPREREKGKLSPRERVLPKSYVCIPSQKREPTDSISPQNRNLQLPDFLRFVYSQPLGQFMAAPLFFCTEKKRSNNLRMFRTWSAQLGYGSYKHFYKLKHF